MRIRGVSINYKKFIQDNFKIIDKEGNVVPFIFNSIQDKLLKDIDHANIDAFEGVRELILKARQHGVSSLIEAMFAVDFLVADRPIGSIILAHKKDMTKKLFEKVKFFITSAIEKQGRKLEDFLETNNKDEIVNKTNSSYIFIATAGAKTGIRGTTVQNVHFSEVAFFGDTDIINAEEIILPTLQTVKSGTGKIFAESTANGFGNWFQNEWQRAIHGQSTFHATFIGVKDNPEYTDKWIVEKRLEYSSEYKFRVDYPMTPEEAFLSSGNTFFDSETLHWLRTECKRDPIQQGYLAPDGSFI